MNLAVRSQKSGIRIPSQPENYYLTQRRKGHEDLHAHSFLLDFFSTYHYLLPTHYYLKPKSKILNPNLSFYFLISNI